MYAYVAVAVVAAALSWQVQNWRFGSIEHERQEIQAKEAARKADRIDQAAVAHEKDKKQIQKEYVSATRKVKHEVEKPVYRNQCFTDDGLRDLSDYIDGKGAGEPEGAVPRPDEAGEHKRR